MAQERTSYMVGQGKCYGCDWGLTHELDVLSESCEEHLSMGCSGPIVIVLVKPRVQGQ